MNYVILNGRNSRSIKGLIIQELPPISKPLIRFEREEIDGRDGDVITKLGYSAYDREISIGLYGNYDVDEVIEYFNSSGQVIFSNEPDKYYLYEIIEQIDFERLIRWKRAKVTFHVQPFKYSTVDDSFSIETMFLEMRNSIKKENDIWVNIANGTIHLYGSTADEGTQIYIPIQNCGLLAGEYILNVDSTGTGKTHCFLKIANIESDNYEMFGGEYISLENNTETIEAEISQQTEYKYIVVYIPAETAIDAYITPTIRRVDMNTITLLNRGNTASKPSLTVYGTGTISISLNETIIFVLTMGNAEYITIDSAKMNAYYGETLMNRAVVGDYEKLLLPVGKNEISWVGNVTNIEVKDFSRWI